MSNIHQTLRKTIPVAPDKNILKFNDDQLKVFWPPDEIKVEKDVQDVLVNFSEAERHGVLTTLKLFSIYEIAAGDEFWGGRFKKMYETNEHHRMASTFAMFENSIHGPFYNKINELLHIDNEDFYLSYLDDPELKARIDHVGEIISNGSDLETLGVFCGVEGVILYSNFAYLKHFQARGKNKLMNIVRGLNFSLRDECLIKGTEVLTTEGWIKIEDVQVGDQILTYDDGKLSFNAVTRTVKSQTKEAYEFSGDDFHQIVTPNHRMVTSEGVVLAKNATTAMEYVNSGFKIGMQSDLTDLDKENLIKCASGELDMSWFHSKVAVADAEWIKTAKTYLISNT